jgi:hypothetical protein
MKRLHFLLAAISIGATLVACGGGDEPVLTPKAKADAAEARARDLIQVSRCTADAQCGFVTFQTPYYSCSQGEHAPYLVAGRNAAAALSAAQDQRFWATEAKKLEPPPNFGCAGYVEPLPIPVCVQSQCTLKSGWPDVVEAAPL